MAILDGDLSKNELVSWLLVPFLLWTLPFTWFGLALFGTIYTAWFVKNQFWHVKWINPNGKVVYITGCDSGFGKAAALELAASGFTVCAGCLNPGKCNELNSNPNIHMVELDVSDEQKVDGCARMVENICGDKGLWALYNNAGYATAGEIEWIQMDVYLAQINVNLWGAVRVTKSVLPLIRHAKGRVVTVTSGIGHPGMPGRSPYSISKGALETFMDCLRYEMAKFHVKCIVVQPGNLTGTTQVFASMVDRVKRVYDTIPSKIRKAYGEEYLNAFYKITVQAYQKSAGNSATTPIDPVIDNIKHAIMAEQPRIRYKPAQFGWIVWWTCYSILPEQLTHYYITKIYMRNFPKPASMVD